MLSLQGKVLAAWGRRRDGKEEGFEIQSWGILCSVLPQGRGSATERILATDGSQGNFFPKT